MQNIEKILHIKIAVKEYDTNKLPLYLKTDYDISLLNIAGIDCLLIKPRKHIKLIALRKQRLQLIKLTGLECVLHFVRINQYSKYKMIEENIPFIIEGKDIYLPFLGMVLSNNKERVLPKVKKISFSTQQLLLTALYKHWTKINVSEAAKDLGVSKMTVSRSFNQLQALGLPLLRETDKERYFVWQKDARALWELIKPYLQKPVMKEYRLDESVSKVYLLGGMSALSHYSNLNDNDYITYAISKEQAKAIDLIKFAKVPENEQPVTVLQVMQYIVNFQNNKAIDPITAYFALDEADRRDSRVEIALNEILEEYVYGSGN